MHAFSSCSSQGTGLVNLSALAGLTFGGGSGTLGIGGASTTGTGGALGVGTLAPGAPAASNYLMLVNIPNILGELDVSMYVCS